MQIKVFPNTTPISIWMRVKRFSLQSMKNTATLVAIIAVTVTSLPSHFAFADTTDVSLAPIASPSDDEPDSTKAAEAAVKVKKVAGPTVKVIGTYAAVPFSAYTSRPEETDDTPFITADGSHVADGIIAANFLKFGTKVRIPKLFGDKVFEVHDRMNKRYPYKIDIWMSEYKDAIQFGVKRADIEIVEIVNPVAEKVDVNEVAIVK